MEIERHELGHELLDWPTESVDVLTAKTIADNHPYKISIHTIRRWVNADLTGTEAFIYIEWMEIDSSGNPEQHKAEIYNEFGDRLFEFAENYEMDLLRQLDGFLPHKIYLYI